MVRTVKKEAHDARRNDILDVALKLIYTKGYTKMSVQDILDERGISKGTLYHYYDSKQAILDALIERMVDDIHKAVLPILQDPNVTAIQKLQNYFEASMQWKRERAEKTVPVLQAWYDQKSDLVRQRFASRFIPQAAAAMELLIRQGIKENTFHTHFPEQIAVQFAQLSLGVSETVARLALAPKNKVTSQKITATLKAYISTVERMFGIPPGSLTLPF